MHQDAEVARRGECVALLLEVALRGEPQPQVGHGRGVVLQQHVLRKVPLRLAGRRAVEAAERALLARLGRLQPPLDFPERAPFSLGIQRLPQQRAHVRRLAPRGDEDVERLGGARQRHVEQVDVVDVGVDQLAVVGLRELRIGHRLLVAHGKLPDGRLLVARPRPDDVGDVAARFGVELPRAVGDDDHRPFEPLGLVDRGDFDGPFALLDAQRAAASLLVPPAQEEGNVGDFARAEGDELLVEGLQVGGLVAALGQVVADDQPLEGLLGREQPQRAAEVALVVGKRRAERPAQEAVVDGAVERVLRVDRQPQRGDEEARHGGVAHDERLARHDVEAVALVAVLPLEAQQLGGHACAVRRAADQNQDVRGAESPVEHLLDALHQGRLARAGRHADISRAVLHAARHLGVVAVGRREDVVQLGGPLRSDGPRGGRLVEHRVERAVVGRDDALHDAVVELDDRRQRAPVVAQVDHLGIRGRELAARLAVENLPVAAPPAVNRLLDVAHQKDRYLLRLRHGVVQQGQEVAPLARRGVLELVYHVALEAVAHLLVDERRVVVADELGQDVLRLREEHRALLVAEALHLRVEVGQQGEAAVVLAQQRRGVPQPDVEPEDVADVAQQGLQPGDERLCGRTFGAPPLGGAAHPLDGGRRRLQLVARRREEVVGEAAALAREVGGRDPRLLHQTQRLARLLLHGAPRRARLLARLAHQTAQLLLGQRAPERLAVLLLEELAREGQNAVADVPAAAVVDALLDEVREPALQLAVLGDALHERVGALGQQTLRLDFDVVVEVEAQLADEGPQDALEEGIDGQHREVRIVVQDVRPHVVRPLLERARVEAELLLQLRGIGAFVARGQQVNLPQDAALHLLGGLVGEGDGQNVAVELRTLDDVVYVFVGQLVGLARTGTGIEYLCPHGATVGFCPLKVRNKSRTEAVFRDNFVI